MCIVCICPVFVLYVFVLEARKNGPMAELPFQVKESNKKKKKKTNQIHQSQIHDGIHNRYLSAERLYVRKQQFEKNDVYFQRHKRNTNNILLQTVTTFEQAYVIPLSTEPYSLTTFLSLA